MSGPNKVAVSAVSLRAGQNGGGVVPLRFRTHCSKGHELTPDNIGSHGPTLHKPRGASWCMECRRGYQKAYHKRKMQDKERGVAPDEKIEWIYRYTYTLECDEQVVFRQPLPKVGDGLWCPRCRDFKVAVERKYLDKVREIYNELGGTSPGVPGDGEEDL